MATTMDLLPALRFPPFPLNERDNLEYHRVIRHHIEKLSIIRKERDKEVKAQISQALKTVDAATNSISFLWLLVMASELPKHVPQSELADAIVRFLVSFDPRQVRYGGPAFMTLCTTVLKPSLLPTSVSITAVSIGLLRLDPSGSVLTKAHVALAEAAVMTGDFNCPELLKVIGKKIIFYPRMYNQTPKRAIASDMSLVPPVFMSGTTGLNPAMEPSEILLYELTCGMIYMGRREWQSAYDCLMRCATHPSLDGGISTITCQAVKKLSLVSLLARGQALQFPPHTSSSVVRTNDTIGKPYQILSVLFESPHCQQLMEHAEDCRRIWEKDQNARLVAECLEAYQKWKIMEMRHIYTKMLIPEIRTQTQSALTGQPCDSDAEVEVMLREMMSSGMLRGEIGTTSDGRTYLEFLPESSLMTEEQYHKELCAAGERLRRLDRLLRVVDERVSTSKEYIKYLVRQDMSGGGRRTRSSILTGAGLDPDLDESMEDEDLMEEAY